MPHSGRSGIVHPRPVQYEFVFGELHGTFPILTVSGLNFELVIWGRAIR
jgi:hypothetical protein